MNRFNGFLGGMKQTAKLTALVTATTMAILGTLVLTGCETGGYNDYGTDEYFRRMQGSSCGEMWCGAWSGFGDEGQKPAARELLMRVFEVKPESATVLVDLAMGDGASEQMRELGVTPHDAAVLLGHAAGDRTSVLRKFSSRLGEPLEKIEAIDSAFISRF